MQEENFYKGYSLNELGKQLLPLVFDSADVNYEVILEDLSVKMRGSRALLITEYKLGQITRFVEIYFRDDLSVDVVYFINPKNEIESNSWGDNEVEDAAKKVMWQTIQRLKQ